MVQGKILGVAISSGLSHELYISKINYNKVGNDNMVPNKSKNGELYSSKCMVPQGIGIEILLTIATRKSNSIVQPLSQLPQK